MLNAIVEQRITQTEAFRTLGWVLRKYGSPAPSTGLGHQPEGMRVYPSARTLATIPTWDWHRAGVDKSRYDAVYAYARSAESLKNIAAEGDVALLARSLHTVRGVGPWSISEVLQRVCGHPDAISVGDYHLAHASVSYSPVNAPMMRVCSPCWYPTARIGSVSCGSCTPLASQSRGSGRA